MNKLSKLNNYLTEILYYPNYFNCIYKLSEFTIFYHEFMGFSILLFQSFAGIRRVVLACGLPLQYFYPHLFDEALILASFHSKYKNKNIQALKKFLFFNACITICDFAITIICIFFTRNVCIIFRFLYLFFQLGFAFVANNSCILSIKEKPFLSHMLNNFFNTLFVIFIIHLR